MGLGLGARLAIVFALLAALTALLTAGVAAASTDRRVKADVDQFLRERAEDITEGRRAAAYRDDERRGRPERGEGERTAPIATAVAPAPPGAGVEAVTDTVSVLRTVEADAEVQFLDRDGLVIESTGIALPVTDADRSLTTLPAQALLRSVDIDGEPYRMITVHVNGGGAVQVAQSVATTNALVGEIRTELLLVGVGLSALAGLVGWGVAQRTTSPLRKLTGAIEDIRDSQDLSRSVSLERSDEIGRLSDSFDELLGTLARSRSQQQQLVQDAAHELRTPLTSVRANIAFLERATDLDEETRQATLASVKGELAELSDLLAEVVELATESRGTASFEPLDLVTAAEAALAQFELRSARPVERDMRSTTVLGDLSMLSRAIGNLIGNADKYTPDESAPVRVVVADGAVTVADRGPGVPEDRRNRIFERFWRADESRSAAGSGLGLAIVAKTVEEHGGTVFVRDRAGGGSEIGFRVEPLHPSTAGAPVDAEGPADEQG